MWLITVRIATRSFCAIKAAGCLLLIASAQTPLPPVQARTQLELGWSNWGLSGNAARFRHYSQPLRGFFLRAIRYERAAIRWLWQGIGDQDTRGDALMHLVPARLTLQAQHARAQFADPGTAPAPLSERLNREATVRYLITPDFALTVRFRDELLRRRFASAHVPYDQTAQAWDMMLEGVAGAGRLSLQYTRWRYRDRTATRPDITLQRWQTGYLWEPTPVLGVEAVWSEAQFEQPQRTTSRLQRLTLATDLTPGDTTTIGLTLERERANLPLVRNNWSRERRTGALSLVQQLGNWRLQIGVRRQAIERVDGESGTEPVQREGLEARLWGRLARTVRLSLYGASQRWSHQPTDEPSHTLFWSRRETARLNLDASLANGVVYLTLSRQRWLNDRRATRLRSDQLLIGGSCTLQPQLTLIAEHRIERWHGTGGADELLALPHFLPDTRSSMVGLQWTVNSRLNASLLYTRFVSSTDNPLLLPDGNTEGRFLTVALRYQLPNGVAWSLTIAPWHYQDRVDSRLDYRINLFALSWSTPF